MTIQRRREDFLPLPIGLGENGWLSVIAQFMQIAVIFRLIVAPGSPAPQLPRRSVNSSKRGGAVKCEDSVRELAYGEPMSPFHGSDIVL